MALELSNFDYDVLDHFLEMICNEHRDGNLALSDARDAVSEAFSMAAFDTRGVTRPMQGLIEVRGKWEIPIIGGKQLGLGSDRSAAVLSPRMRSSWQIRALHRDYGDLCFTPF